MDLVTLLWATIRNSNFEFRPKRKRETLITLRSWQAKIVLIRDFGLRNSDFEFQTGKTERRIGANHWLNLKKMNLRKSLIFWSKATLIRGFVAVTRSGLQLVSKKPTPLVSRKIAAKKMAAAADCNLGVTNWSWKTSLWDLYVRKKRPNCPTRFAQRKPEAIICLSG